MGIAPWLVENYVRGGVHHDGWWLSDPLVPVMCDLSCCWTLALVHLLDALQMRPQVRRDYPLSLSISISGGKETNKDSLSNGERTGKSPL